MINHTRRARPGTVYYPYTRSSSSCMVLNSRGNPCTVSPPAASWETDHLEYHWPTRILRNPNHKNITYGALQPQFPSELKYVCHPYTLSVLAIFLVNPYCPAECKMMSQQCGIGGMQNSAYSHFWAHLSRHTRTNRNNGENNIFTPIRNCGVYCIRASDASRHRVGMDHRRMIAKLNEPVPVSGHPSLALSG